MGRIASVVGTPAPVTVTELDVVTDPRDYATGSDTASISGFGQLLSKLKAMRDGHSARAIKALNNIADKLERKALGTSGTDAERLSGLAGEFRAAAESGDLPTFTPRSAVDAVGRAPRPAQRYQFNQGSGEVTATMNSVSLTDTGSIVLLKAEAESD